MTMLIAIGASAPVALLVPAVLWVRYRRRLHARDSSSSTGGDLHKPSIDAPSVELEMTDIEAFHLAHVSGPRARCAICATDEPEAGGLRCRGAEKHFTCQDCLDGFVRSCATPDSAARMDDGGWRLYCPLGPQCDARHPATAKALDPAEVRSRVSRGAWGAFERAKSDAAKAVAQRQREAADRAQRRPAILTAAAAGDESRAARLLSAEVRDALTLFRPCCPSAGWPYSAAAWNFFGETRECAVMTCSACESRFCGLCLKARLGLAAVAAAAPAAGRRRRRRSRLLLRALALIALPPPPSSAQVHGKGDIGWRAGHKHLHESCASNPEKNYYIPGETQAEAAAYIASGHRAVKRRQLAESLSALQSAGAPRLLAALAPYAGVLRSELVWSVDDALAASRT